MIEFRSYLREADETFVRVSDASKWSGDSDYVEGAVEFIVDGKELLGKRHWDYIDQLWVYLVDLDEELDETGRATTYYPDQALEIKAERRGSTVVLTIDAGGDEKRIIVDRAELSSALRQEAKAFFQKMIDVIPANSGTYGRELARIRSLGQ